MVCLFSGPVYLKSENASGINPPTLLAYADLIRNKAGNCIGA